MNFALSFVLCLGAVSAFRLSAVPTIPAKVLRLYKLPAQETGGLVVLFLVIPMKLPHHIPLLSHVRKGGSFQFQPSQLRLFSINFQLKKLMVLFLVIPMKLK